MFKFSEYYGALVQKGMRILLLVLLLLVIMPFAQAQKRAEEGCYEFVATKDVLINGIQRGSPFMGQDTRYGDSRTFPFSNTVGNDVLEEALRDALHGTRFLVPVKGGDFSFAFSGEYSANKRSTLSESVVSRVSVSGNVGKINETFQAVGTCILQATINYNGESHSENIITKQVTYTVDYVGEVWAGVTTYGDSVYLSINVGPSYKGTIGTSGTVRYQGVYHVVKDVYTGSKEPEEFDFTENYGSISIRFKAPNLLTNQDDTQSDKQVTETTTIAEEEAGENEGEDIPWTFIVVGAVAAGGAAVAITKGGKGKGKDKNKPKPKQPSSFRMIIYKDFGDTLIEKDPPRLIGARIEEITPEGNKIDRLDLTAKITISAESNCVVDDVSLEGRYMSGAIVGYQTHQDNDIEGVAKVRFVFNGPNGILVNHVIFRLVDAPEIVMEEAITFEAEGGKTQHIDFGINNYKGTILDVKVKLEPEGAKYFTPTLEACISNPLQYRINLTEHGKMPEPPASSEGQAQQQKPIAGDAECFRCNVAVQLEGREKPVTNSFMIYRIHLGLRLDIRALKAYLVDYDSDCDHEVLVTDPKKPKKWGESKVVFQLYAEEPKTGKIKTVIPDGEPQFTFEDIREGSLMFADKNGNIIQSPCALMAFKFELKDVLYENTIHGVIHSTGGGLYPPNRAKAKVTLRASYGGRTFETSEIVTITSQPYRVIDDEREYSRVLHEDEEKMRQLTDLRCKLRNDDRFAELIPYYYKVESMIEGYDARFGFYEPDYQKLMRIFKKYCSGEIGHYFVNDAVWKPEWTEADETFNAFIATYASMERSWSVIGMRIALGIFTAGASELVLTPYSAMVGMKNYVDKGGDSAVKAFVIASGEVLFWEGAFYAGGEALKWGLNNTEAGKKIKDMAAKTAQKMKEPYAKLKESAMTAWKGKEATKNLSGVKSVNTKELGDKVVKAGEKVKQTKSGAKAHATEAIRKTMEEGADDVVRFGSSKFNEECAKRARQDAEKILENFKKVMNNPTATQEEMRRATLALQGNKAAQNLLRESKSDLLRANFNHEIKLIYDEVDKPTIKKLAERLKLKEIEIRKAPNASSNSGQDLYLGKKIGADRDVTYQFKDKNGNWVDIDESIQQQAYCEAFNEYHYGFMPKDQQQALKTLQKFDQAVVNGETGAESFGKDLQNIIDKVNQGNKLVDPDKVATTVKYKCEMWLGQGKACRDQAEQLYNMGLVDEAMRVMGYGEELVKEGVRMNVKEFKRILDPRIQAAISRGTAVKDYKTLYAKISILERVATPPPKGTEQISLESARLTLQNQFGTTLEKVMEECVDAIKEINNCL